MQEITNFIDINEETPKVAGDYFVKILRDGQEKVVKKRLYFSSSGAPVWMGGVRPFSQNDQVIAWHKPTEVSSE